MSTGVLLNLLNELRISFYCTILDHALNFHRWFSLAGHMVVQIVFFV